MEQSILKGTKKILGVGESDTSFDHDIITFINSAFSSLNQLGVGPEESFFIEDDSAVWDDFHPTIPQNQLRMVQSYIYLKVRVMFDPPTTSFHIEAMNKQILEHEWRLNVFREPPIEEVTA